MTFKIKIRGTNQEFTCEPGDNIVNDNIAKISDNIKTFITG